MPSAATATGVRIGLGQDLGQAGKSQALHLVRALSGFTVSPAPQSGENLRWFGATQLAVPGGQCEDPARAWNEELFRILEGFPDLAHDDEVDASSGDLEMLNRQM
jgi:predicted phage terminase large subunit-like protein